VFTRTGATWTQQAKLVPADGTAGDYFGFAVAVDADTVVVGAPDVDDDGRANIGAAYVFTRAGGTWAQQARLTATDARAGAKLGISVALDGDTVVAGASSDFTAGLDAGAAYVFTRAGATWSQQATLLASDADKSDFFGHAVAINANTVVVGAYADDDKGSGSGSVYVFTRTGTTWSQQGKLVAPDGRASEQLGRAVALERGTVVAGAPGASPHGTGSGAVWILPTG